MLASGMAYIHNDLTARFEWARQDLEAVLNKLNDSDLSWCPGEGLRSIVGLLTEIANKEREALVWLRTGIWPDGEPVAFDEQGATLADIRVTLGLLRTATYAYLTGLNESQLAERIDNPNRWWEGMRLTSCPRSEVIRNIAVHEWYHTGQLVIYLCMLGRESCCE